MKEYIIRKVGWAYDDSNYQYDEKSGIVDWFSIKKYAVVKTKRLNRRYLVSNFWRLSQYELEGQKTATDIEKRKKLDNYLVNELSFNPTIKLYPQFKGYYDFKMFLVPPSDEQLDKIIELSGIEFFRVVEVNKEHPAFWKAYLTADYLFRKENAYLYHLENYEPIFFSSKFDAFKWFKNNSFNFQSIFNTNSEESILKGTPEELSVVPAIFEDFVLQNQSISYENNKLSVSKSIDIAALQKLNELLKKPFLKFEKISITEDLTIEGMSARQNVSIEKDISELEFRNHRLRTLDSVKESDDYLQLFYREFSWYQQNYSSILKLHLSKHKLEAYYTEQSKWHISQYKYRGVITEAIERNGQYKVTSIFKINKMEESLKSTGKGKTLEAAFENSFDNWLEEHQKIWMPILTRGK